MITAGGLFDLLVRSSLLLAMIWIAAAAVRKARGSAAMRHMVWLLGLGALILIPFLSALAPPLRLAIVPVIFVSPPEMVMAIEGTATAGPGAATPVASLGFGDLIQLLYLAVAAGLLGRLALGHYVLARLWRRARPVRDPRWEKLLGGLASNLGIRRTIALRIAGGPAMPMTWGTFRPRILFPAEALIWTDERRRIVLLHELAHVSRRDSLSRTVAAIVCALYWFHPAIWHAARRMRLEQEHACDDLVLSQGAKASAYARNLLEVAGTFQPPRIATDLSVAMARTSELERRLTAIIRCGPRRRSSSRFVAGTSAAALVATFLIATIAPVAAFRGVPAPGLDSNHAARVSQRTAGAPVHPGVAAGDPLNPVVEVDARGAQAPAAAFESQVVFAKRSAAPTLPTLPTLPTPPTAPIPPTPPTALTPPPPPPPLIPLARLAPVSQGP